MRGVRAVGCAAGRRRELVSNGYPNIKTYVGGGPCALVVVVRGGEGDTSFVEFVSTSISTLLAKELPFARRALNLEENKLF